MIRRLTERMRDDLRLAIVTLYAICVSSAVGSFAFFRLASGDVLIGFVDLLIVAFFVGLTVLAWQPGRTRLAANITAGVAALAVVGVVLVLGLSPLWMFSTVVANFLMADRRFAVIANAVMIGSIGLTPSVSDNMTEHVTLVTVAIVTSLFSLIFAGRVHSQRKQLSRLAEHDVSDRCVQPPLAGSRAGTAHRGFKSSGRGSFPGVTRPGRFQGAQRRSRPRCR